MAVTASVTVDVNGERQNPDMRLLNTMNTLIGDSSPLPVIFIIAFL
jgi:hypothetical protein